MTVATPPPTTAFETEAVSETVTVVIADDHPLFRRGVARAIRRSTSLELIGEATNGEEALDLVSHLQPDVAVLDHRMPGLSGVEVCACLRRSAHPPRTAVLILSAFEGPDMVAAAVEAGAAGYVGKTASQGEICAMIERVGRGREADAASGPILDESSPAAPEPGTPTGQPEPE